jgi:Diacylglycerol acyltransferase
MQGMNYILAAQPHGFLSMCCICSAVKAEKEFRGTIPTGVAKPVLRSPIVKHIMGIFNLILASKSSLKKQLQKGGIKGTVIWYAGGIAETFLSSDEVVVLYLSKRRGFIKLALQDVVDVIPIYLFGKTSVLSVIETGLLASLSRWVSL